MSSRWGEATLLCRNMKRILFTIAIAISAAVILGVGLAEAAPPSVQADVDSAPVETVLAPSRQMTATTFTVDCGPVTVDGPCGAACYVYDDDTTVMAAWYVSGTGDITGTGTFTDLLYFTGGSTALVEEEHFVTEFYEDDYVVETNSSYYYPGGHSGWGYNEFFYPLHWGLTGTEVMSQVVVSLSCYEKQYYRSLGYDNYYWYPDTPTCSSSPCPLLRLNYCRLEGSYCGPYAADEVDVTASGCLYTWNSDETTQMYPPLGGESELWLISYYPMWEDVWINQDWDTVIVSANGLSPDGGGSSSEDCTVMQTLSFDPGDGIVIGHEIESLDLPPYGIDPLVNGVFRDYVSSTLVTVYEIDIGDAYSESIETHAIQWSSGDLGEIFETPVCTVPELGGECPEPDWPVWEIGNWIVWLWCKLQSWFVYLLSWLSFLQCGVHWISVTIANGIAEFFYNIWIDAASYFDQLASLLFNFFDQLGNFLEMAFYELGVMVASAFNEFGNFLEDAYTWWGLLIEALWTAWGEWIAGWFDELGNTIEEGYTWWGTVIQTAWTAWGNWISGWFNELGNTVEEGFVWWGQALQGAFTAWGNWIAGWFDEFGNLAEGGFVWLGQTISAVFNACADWITLYGERFAAWASGLGTELGDFLAMMVLEFSTFLAARMNWIGQTIGDFFISLGQFLNMSITEYGAWLGDLMAWVGDVFSELFSGMGELLNRLLTSFGAWLGNLMTWFGSTVGGFYISLGQFLNAVLTGYGMWLGNVMAWFGSTVGGFYISLGQFLNMLFTEVGAWLGSLLAEIGRFLNQFVTGLGSVLASILRALGGGIGSFIDLFKSLLSLVITWVRYAISLVSSVGGATATLGTGVKAALDSTETVDLTSGVPYFLIGLQYFETVVDPTPLALLNYVVMGFIALGLFKWTIEQYNGLVQFLMGL